jgi:hypothetical protein
VARIARVLGALALVGIAPAVAHARGPLHVLSVDAVHSRPAVRLVGPGTRVTSVGRRGVEHNVTTARSTASAGSPTRRAPRPSSRAAPARTRGGGPLSLDVEHHFPYPAGEGYSFDIHGYLWCTNCQ